MTKKKFNLKLSIFFTVNPSCGQPHPVSLPNQRFKPVGVHWDHAGQVLGGSCWEVLGGSCWAAIVLCKLFGPAQSCLCTQITEIVLGKCWVDHAELQSFCVKLLDQLRAARVHKLLNHLFGPTQSCLSQCTQITESFVRSSTLQDNSP